MKLQISEICSLLNVDGIRGDIVTNRAARALVAFEGRDVVSMDDVKRIIGVCVNHRCELLISVCSQGNCQSTELDI